MDDTTRTCLKINGYSLEMTSIACPEQYDVYAPNGSHAGYLRLRNGWFRADCPDCGGKTVYEAHTRGDGCFDDDEREPQLTAAVDAIDNYWKTVEGSPVTSSSGPVAGFIHPDAYSGDVLNQLKNWRSRHMAHTGELIEMAAQEISRLRGLLGRMGVER